MSSSKKIILFSLISASVFALVLIFVIFPLFNSIKGISEKITAFKKDIAFFESDFVKAGKFNDSYDSLEITPEKIDSCLVNSSVPIDFIEFLEATAKDAGLVSYISPAIIKKTNKDPWQSIGFSIDLIGDFPKTMKFLEKIETGCYFIQVQKLHTREINQQDVSFQKYRGIYDGQLITSLEIKVFAKI